MDQQQREGKKVHDTIIDSDDDDYDVGKFFFCSLTLN